MHEHSFVSRFVTVFWCVLSRVFRSEFELYFLRVVMCDKSDENY